MTAPSRPLIERIVGRKRRFASRRFVALGSRRPELVFIAGTGRSGTTWLAELLTRQSRRRLIFEPFRPDRVPLWQDASHRQYLRAGDDCTPLLEPAAMIMSGRFRNDWTDHLNGRLLTAGKIIKDIRANLILRWLYEQLGPFPIIYLIRNPEAVVHSWQRENWSVSPADVLLTQRHLVEDYLAPFETAIRGATDPREQLLYLWCVENWVPLQQFQREEVLIVFYENLILDPEKELLRIARFTGIPQSSLDRTSFDRPSATTTPGVTYLSQEARLGSSRDPLSSSEQDQMRSIIGAFGLNVLYERDGLPVVPGDEVIELVARAGSLHGSPQSARKPRGGDERM